ncbi:hypothetical protein Pmar_PMAR007490 [Perkinsus marinus ATCC 50983]|uniref:Proteinase inhibitor I42 chagasin domain-containing protein n=1 Tax=Perkinsus marinus (strain ATCC 50983 / TXsc) TaxID=423536 RepID=C5M062_PERM5|nr:hypothetical protein Pmar_PMAR007490 [Perkinsus marinus ATCC 50983]EEQ97640.1 hypothetical protein Pmar_PMAR007490 [Perkinsus marinus ATCC 50983]|eukprot:XP_002764923.1 hypothetical protein Pmar_PMAR007490 [Perkinsus marinus ATCC 50983]
MQGIVRHQLAPGSVVNLTANVGEVIEVSLVGNPTTGYSWQDADRRGSIEVQTSTGSQPGAHPENSDSGHETIVSKNGLERRLSSSSSFTVENASMVVRYLAQVFKVNPHPLGYVGTGGIYYFYYQAVRPGYCQLRFVYTRPWEHVPIPEEHYARVNIRVLDTTINGTEVERVQLPEDSTASQMYIVL